MQSSARWGVLTVVAGGAQFGGGEPQPLGRHARRSYGRLRAENERLLAENVWLRGQLEATRRLTLGVVLRELVVGTPS